MIIVILVMVHEETDSLVVERMRYKLGSSMIAIIDFVQSKNLRLSYLAPPLKDVYKVSVCSGK